MTKYILHGGNTSTKSEDNDKFFRETVKGLSSPVRLLIVYFSREEKDWLSLLEQDKENFSSVGSDKGIEFILADKDKQKLIQQIKEADAVYMRGGETSKLKKALAGTENLKELFEGKVVAGSSAGAYVLSKYYVSSSGELNKGLGILPIKTFAHYKESRKSELEKLKNCGEHLTTYPLEEMKFVILMEDL